MADGPISVYDHRPALDGLQDETFAQRVDELTEELCRGQALAHLLRRRMDDVLKPLVNDPARPALFSKIAQYDTVRIACGTLQQLVELLPPPKGRISCHLIPGGGTRGSGVCFAPDALLVAVPGEGDILAWLPFVVTHEYSHILRGFNEHKPDTLRDALVFEGLGMVLAETLSPLAVVPYPWEKPSPEAESEFWRMIEPDATDDEAYARYLNSDMSYAIGASIVRHYLSKHELSIIPAHRVPNDELYWDSGYPGLR